MMDAHWGKTRQRPGWLFDERRGLVTLAGRIGVAPGDSSETVLQKRLVVLLAVGTLPFTGLWSAIYCAAGVPFTAAIPALYSIVTPLNTLVFAWTRHLGYYRFSQLLLTLFLPWLVTMSLGGFRESSVVIIWAALCPLVALLLGNLRQTMPWIVGFVALLAVSAFAQPHLAPARLPEAFVTWFFVLNLGAVIAIVFGLLYYFVGQRNFFQERSETLLNNILPREISDALKTDRRAIAMHHEAASILFADVVSFTPMAASMSPLSLVDLLNDVFQCFDDLVEKHGLEKIKTIGDCYMVASGVPRSRPDHAAVLVQLGLDMRDAVARRRFGGRELVLRIGINSGPVVAGVIGRNKFTYDLWGASVNVASRMATQGQSRIVQITRNTYDLIKDMFDCEAHGTINLKGVGQVEAWHVLAARPGAFLVCQGTKSGATGSAEAM